MAEQTDLRELRERMRTYVRAFDGLRNEYTNASEIAHRDMIAAALERLGALEALRTRLQVFLAAVGASTPDDHPWVVEARALANALRPCELATPALAPQQGEPDD